MERERSPEVQRRGSDAQLQFQRFQFEVPGLFRDVLRRLGALVSKRFPPPFRTVHPGVRPDSFEPAKHEGSTLR